MLKRFLLFVSMVSCRRIHRGKTPNSFHDSMVALGAIDYGHAIFDEAFFYDFMSLSIDFNKQNLTDFIRVNFNPTFAGFSDEQFNTLLENWIFGMLATGY